MHSRLDDYIDADVAYLAGLIIGRGTIAEVSGVRQLTIEFSYQSLEAQGISSTFSLDTAIRLGLDKILDRLQELLDTDIQKIAKNNGVHLVIRFMRHNMIWRNILLLTEGKTDYAYFRIPKVFLDPELPVEWKREFVRGFADVAGNIRHANRYVDGRHRVRLDVLNYPTNWELPVQLCTLLQDHLDVPVQLITWGHPNMGRDFREHQINVFAQPFLKVGFSLEYKQQILTEFAEFDAKSFPDVKYGKCPGLRRPRDKPTDQREHNADKLDKRLWGKHFDSYWQICKVLGCTRQPQPNDPTDMAMAEETIEEG